VKPLSVELVQRMYADYQSGMSLAAVARRHGKHRKSLHQVFQRRGLILRPTKKLNGNRNATGQFEPAKPLTERQITALIAEASKLAVPVALKLQWRKWSLERRGQFIARLLAKLKNPKDRPQGSLSKEMMFFDYATPEANQIAREMNAGRDSHTAAIKIDICSQGIIWRGRLWFWCSKVGYQSGPWIPGGGRPSLHHVIWEEHHGRKVPAGSVLIFADGNKNNFAPRNLRLVSRNQICRQNHAAALFRKSREVTSILLARAQRKGGARRRTVSLKELRHA
jgi:transposase-like protein